MRFMRVVRAPDRERLRAVLASFPEAGIGIVATVPAADGIDIVGSAIAVFAADRTSCEFAITVASGFGGVGLATALMTALIDEAQAPRPEGDGRLRAVAEPVDAAAWRSDSASASRYEPGDASVRICRLTLNPS